MFYRTTFTDEKLCLFLHLHALNLPLSNGNFCTYKSRTCVIDLFHLNSFYIPCSVNLIVLVCYHTQEHQRHNISVDTWQQVLAFSRCVNEDLDGYDPKGSPWFFCGVASYEIFQSYISFKKLLSHWGYLIILFVMQVLGLCSLMILLSICTGLPPYMGCYNALVIYTVVQLVHYC